MKIFFYVILIFLLCACVSVPNKPVPQNIMDRSVSLFTVERRNALLINNNIDEVEFDLSPDGDLKSEVVSSDEIDSDTHTVKSNVFEGELYLPKSIDIKMDFVSQAPFVDWSEPYDEACEEASMVMIAYRLKKLSLTKQNMDNEIRGLVEWQNQTFGYYKDTTAQENSLILKNFFKLDALVAYDPSIDFLRQKLATGNLIMAHVSGRDLGNPHFHQPGPLYHVLVIRGYDKDGFITNDPGTRHGESYHYSYDVIMNALHDWNGGDVTNGRPVVVVVSK